MTLWVILPVTAEPVIAFAEAGRSVIFYGDLSLFAGARGLHRARSSLSLHPSLGVIFTAADRRSANAHIPRCDLCETLAH